MSTPLLGLTKWTKVAHVHLIVHLTLLCTLPALCISIGNLDVETMRVQTDDNSQQSEHSYGQHGTSKVCIALLTYLQLELLLAIQPEV